MFAAALCTPAKNFKRARCPSMGNEVTTVDIYKHKKKWVIKPKTNKQKDREKPKLHIAS